MWSICCHSAMLQLHYFTPGYNQIVYANTVFHRCGIYASCTMFGHFFRTHRWLGHPLMPVQNLNTCRRGHHCLTLWKCKVNMLHIVYISQLLFLNLIQVSTKIGNIEFKWRIKHEPHFSVWASKPAVQYKHTAPLKSFVHCKLKKFQLTNPLGSEASKLKNSVPMSDLLTLLFPWLAFTQMHSTLSIASNKQSFALWKSYFCNLFRGT